MKRRKFVVTGSLGLMAIHPASGSARGFQEKKQYVCPPCGCRMDNEVHDEAGICPGCNMPRVEKTPELREVKSIFTFTRVSDKVWTGGQPTLEQMDTLKTEGVKLVINLRPASEHNGEVEEARMKELGIRYINIPVVYLKPTDEDADRFLKVTDAELKNDRVLIHCTAAVRVSAFMMIRRVLRDGWEYDKALEEANKNGLRNREHLINFAKAYIEKNQKK
ncbi:MAG: fused DSP-PTPase phosphatase/NAD kinase-like protein [Blastocatellia bacterium]